MDSLNLPRKVEPSILWTKKYSKLYYGKHSIVDKISVYSWPKKSSHLVNEFISSNVWRRTDLEDEADESEEIEADPDEAETDMDEQVEDEDEAVESPDGLRRFRLLLLLLLLPAWLFVLFWWLLLTSLLLTSLLLPL